MSETVLQIYTDGACKGNPGTGGWGAILKYGIHTKEFFGGEKATTNNRMEIMAVISALEKIKPEYKGRIEIYTDSKYVQDGTTKWMASWKKNGWKTQSRSAVKNQDLWQRLVAATAPHHISWDWVRGHQGHPENERADRLAVAQAKAWQSKNAS